ncbi:hypothetical protein JZ751_028637, partial [Albula glossodonta]
MRGTQMSDGRATVQETVCQLENILVKQVAPLSEVQKTEAQNVTVNHKGGKAEDFMNLLQKLGLQGSYPKRMTKSNVLVLDGLSLSVQEPKMENDLSSLYLYKLMTLDYRARYLFVKPEAISMDLEEEGPNAQDDDDLFDFDDRADMVPSSKQTQIHPMDVHMAIFHCSGSTPDSLLMKGVVEIAWYCPGGKDDDIFDDCVAFLNLHGVTMLLSGYPLELMDGDAAHVPLTWIKAVLDELTKTIGDRKVFVLSILGLQSSGKSTLLNTMFGLQFAVSAGRCTRGAFMQLVEVDSSIRNQLGYDFVLIIDTEGLRSPELSTKISLTHDNELATFIIGIGDMTVINIMGENPSEMHDILQICVQAFMRMKQVKITPSCIFVHQNVAEAAAGDKNIEGRRRLLEKLDEMAQMAAEEEHVDGISCFSDVIQFDIETQVFYFKGLLEGDPPMAPPNPSYSQNVQQLKTKLLTVASWQEKCKFSSLSEFKCRVSDLWTALLQENFVFSFRNTVELMVYNSLEQKYGDWSWKLRKHFLNLQTKLQNQIGSGLMLDVSLVDLTAEFDKVYNPLKKEIEKYFTEDKNKETLIKWKANIETRFKSLRHELIDRTVKQCKDLLNSKKSRSELDQRKAKYTDELTEQSKRLASELKSLHLKDEQIIEEFDNLWVNWTTEVLKSQPREEPVNVKAVVEGQLQGCWAQCPFCKAICTNTIPNHDGDHSVKFHRCEALAGWHYHNTDNFSVDFCTTKGEWFPYKTYKDAGDPYDKWSITPDGSVQRYWKWFIWHPSGHAVSLSFKAEIQHLLTQQRLDTLTKTDCPKKRPKWMSAPTSLNVWKTKTSDILGSRLSPLHKHLLNAKVGQTLVPFAHGLWILWGQKLEQEHREKLAALAEFNKGMDHIWKQANQQHKELESEIERMKKDKTLLRDFLSHIVKDLWAQMEHKVQEYHHKLEGQGAAPGDQQRELLLLYQREVQVLQKEVSGAENQVQELQKQLEQ